MMYNHQNNVVQKFFFSPNLLKKTRHLSGHVRYSLTHPTSPLADQKKQLFCLSLYIYQSNRNALKWTILNRVTRKISLKKNGFNKKNDSGHVLINNILYKKVDFFQREGGIPPPLLADMSAEKSSFFDALPKLTKLRPFCWTKPK